MASTDIALMAAASSTVRTLREVLTQLSAADAATAFQAIVKARPVLHVATDRLRIALKGRGARKQRVNQQAVNLWDCAGPAGTGPTRFRKENEVGELPSKISANR